MSEARVLLSAVPSTEEVIEYKRFSSWTKLIRTVAQCRRFVHNLRNSSNKFTALSLELINQATNDIIRNVQSTSFKEELSSLSRAKDLNKKTHILSLSPFLDENGMSRVGGRLRHSKLAYTVKHPVLLPHNHHVSLLITRHEHISNMHSGLSLTLASMRNKYWIVRAKNIIRLVMRKCVLCFRQNPIHHQPMMGDLPENRVTASSRPFMETGIDYAGPFLLKDGSRRSKRTIKAYVVVFICFTTKAIHLEITGDLTTQNFIATLRRFISRRGKPSRITSDNATTFKGAHNELQEWYELLSEESANEIREAMLNEGIKWEFISPRAPNFGGLWEAGVKSFKKHFKKMVGQTRLTYEEMLTLLNQIEYLLNSRPISPLSTDPNDFAPLTPNHFLIGDLVNTLHDPDLSHLKLNRLSHWQFIQRLKQEFWSRWQTEYLTTLQRRNKWNTPEKFPIKTDSIVIIAEDNLPAAQWRMGRVRTSLKPGKDGISRVACVKTANGEIVRSVNKLCSLPSD